MNKLFFSLLLTAGVVSAEPFRLQYPTNVTVEETLELKTNNEHKIHATLELTHLEENETCRLLSFEDKHKTALNSWVAMNLVGHPIAFSYDRAKSKITIVDNLKVDLEEMLQNMMWPVMLLAGQDLEEGVTGQFELGYIYFVIYNVTDVTDTEVSVEIQVGSFSTDLRCEIEATFNKENAFLHTIEMDYDEEASFFFIPFKEKVKLHLESKLAL